MEFLVEIVSLQMLEGSLICLCNYRISRPQIFFKIGVPKNFAKFTGKLRPKACNFVKKETLVQMLSCEFCEILKNTFFIEHLWCLLQQVFDLFVQNILNFLFKAIINYYIWMTSIQKHTILTFLKSRLLIWHISAVHWQLGRE